MNQIWSVGLLLTNLLFSPSVIEVVHHPVAVPAYAQAQNLTIDASSSPQEIKDYITTKSELLGLNSGTTTGIAMAESSLRPNAVGKNGDDSGVYQLNNATFQEKCIDKYHYATDLTQKNDLVIQIDCALQLMKDGQYWRWASSRDKWDRDYLGNNCVSYVKSKGIKLPRIIDAGNLDSNSSVPVKNGVVIMVYNGIHHLAYIESVEADGIHLSEGNYNKGMITSRIIQTTDTHIIGYYRPRE